MRILAYTKYGREAASTRYRVLQYIPALEAAGITVDHRPLIPDDYVRSLATSAGFSKAALLRSYAERLGDLVSADRAADLIWVYAELLPYLPAAIESLVLRRKVPVIYDWDDAFFVPYEEHRNPLVRAVLGRKFPSVLRHVAATTCGNAYLQDYCSRFCPTNLVVPTVVDIDAYRPTAGRSGDRPLTLGWIGSPSTWSNVRPLLPLIHRFCREHQARFRVIGAGSAARGDEFESAEFVDWAEDREIAEVQAFDIGIMPLIDAPFQRGKSGFKLIQYMACGVAAVGSPVGVNADIITHGESGLLATSEEEWATALERLATDSDLRGRLGSAGRERVVSHYSLQSQAPRLIELFRSFAR